MKLKEIILFHTSLQTLFYILVFCFVIVLTLVCCALKGTTHRSWKIQNKYELK